MHIANMQSTATQQMEKGSDESQLSQLRLDILKAYRDKEELQFIRKREDAGDFL